MLNACFPPKSGLQANSRETAATSLNKNPLGTGSNELLGGTILTPLPTPLLQGEVSLCNSREDLGSTCPALLTALSSLC